MTAILSVLHALPFLVIMLFAAALFGIPLDLYLGIVFLLFIGLLFAPKKTKARGRNRRRANNSRYASNPPNRTTRGLVNDSAHPTRGLIIESAPLEKILAGNKTWEMRSRKTNIRGPIALIKKGSGKIYGLARIVDSIGPFSESEMIDHSEKHCMSPDRITDPRTSKWRQAWVLEEVTRLDNPIDYLQKRGPVQFVTLDEEAIKKIKQCNRKRKRFFAMS